MAEATPNPVRSSQRFRVVVRDAEDERPTPRSPLAPPSNQHNRHEEAQDSLLDKNAHDAGPRSEEGTEGEDGASFFSIPSNESSDEVDVDALAYAIGVNPADVLRYLQENPQDQTDDPRRMAAMLKCHATFRQSTTRSSGNGNAAQRPPLSPVVMPNGAASTASPLGRPTLASREGDDVARSTPQLVALQFATGEDGQLMGGESEMTPSCEDTQDVPSSQIVFKHSGSNFSSSQRHLSDVATPRNPQPKGIHFSSNVVTNVIVYEVDQELYVGVEYSRHWIGWASLFIAFILEIVFDVHIGWFVYVDRSSAGYLCIQNWVAVIRAMMSCIYMLSCALMGIGVAPSLSYSFSCKGFTITTIMSFCLAGALALEIVTSELADTPHFFSTSVLHCAWIVVFRVLTKQMVFFAEAIGVAVAVCGFIIANVHVDDDISFYTDAVGNVVMLISSILYAAYFLIQEYLRQRSPSAPMVFNIGLIAPIAGFALAMAYSSPLNAGVNGMYGMFNSENVVHASLLAVEGLFVNVCFLAALMYLDLLSVSACYALKSVFAPMFMHYLVWERYPDLQPAIDKAQWGVWFFVGLVIVVAGSGTVIYFASVKRRFVARRIAHNCRRTIPNPYRKRRGNGGSKSQFGATAASPADAIGVGLDVHPAASTMTTTRPSSPSRRASVDSRNGGRRIVLNPM